MVNFRIIEGIDDEEAYQQFKEGYFDLSRTVASVVKELGLTQNKYLRFRRRVTEETGYRRPHHIQTCSKDDLNRYIYPTASGKYEIRKRLNGKQYQFGTFSNFEIACEVRRICESHNWDVSLIPSLKEKYMKVVA